jgi:hypothetical protein
MGTDIHCYAEVRRDGRWEKIGRIFPNPSWRQEDAIEDQPELGWYLGPLTDRPYIRRNYPLFGMLAGVRYSEIEPIAKPVPRGIPVDVSPGYRARVRERSGGQWHSWLTLAELQAYDWDAPCGFWPDWDDPAFQPVWDAYTARREAANAIGQEFDPGERERPMPPSRLHTRRELADEFLTETMPRLAELGAPEDVRIVFYFD